MARKIIEDIVREKREREKEREKKDFWEEPKKEEAPEPKKPSKTIKIIFILVCLVAIFVIIALGVINFSSATVKIKPHQEFLDIKEEIKMGLETTRIEIEDSQSAVPTEFSSVGQKARGQIVVYNTSDTAQKLIINTRFEAPDGKIYRIQKEINIPANGSTETTVYADKPGPEYNIGLVDFTVPGLKGTSRYTKIYGRSKTEMRGGTNEKSPVVSESDLKRVQDNLKTKIEKVLREKISGQKPKDYLLYNKAIKVDFIEDPANPKAGEATTEFTLKMKGIATGYLINKDGLEKLLAAKYFPNYKKETGIRVANLEEIDFNLVSVDEQAKEIIFNIKGKAHFVWNINNEVLIEALLNAGDKGYQKIFENFPEIDKAEIIFRPAWWPYLTKNKSKIHIETTL